MKRTISFVAGPIVVGVLACAASGCTPTELTESGQQVRVGKADPADGCQEIGPVFGSGAGGYSTTSEDKMTSAENELRNHAAEQGANYVVMDALGSDVHGMTMSGRAFRCDRLPSNVAPQGNAAAPTADPEARLRKLKDLLDKGLITPEDYDRRRAEILQSL